MKRKQDEKEVAVVVAVLNLRNDGCSARTHTRTHECACDLIRIFELDKSAHKYTPIHMYRGTRTHLSTYLFKVARTARRAYKCC